MAAVAHVLSDVHLEMGGWRADISTYFRDRAEYLFLAGDIGDPREECYRDFLMSCAARYGKVFVVLGNHECYGGTVEETARLVREVCAPAPNLIFLDRETHDLGAGVRVAGLTLWSHVTDDQRADVGCFVADYRRIEGWTVQRNNDAHRRGVEWLAREIGRAKTDGVRLIVLSHHAPLPNSAHPRHAGSPMSSAFETDLSGMMSGNSHVTHWVHGHTHFSDVRTRHGTIVLSNQLGYSRENGTRFDASRAFVIDR